MTSRFIARTAAVAGALAVVAISGAALAAPASAAQFYEIDYQTTGSTTLANPNSNAVVNFAPATLQSFVAFDDNGAAVKAYLPLAPAKSSYLAYGFLPAKGTVVFTQVGAATGRLGNYDPATGFPLAVTAKYVVSLRDVTIGGTPANVGPNCQTLKPVTVTVTAEPGFDLVNGVLNGTYNLSNFYNCGKAQTIINDTLPGSGNTLQLNIHIGSGADSRASAAAVRTHNAA